MGRARFLVQYRIDDELFPRTGMEQAHDHLNRLHADNGRYRGSFKPGGHAFDAAGRGVDFPLRSPLKGSSCRYPIQIMIKFPLP